MKIEGDNIAAYEIAHQLDLLHANIELCKVEKYIDPKTEAEKRIQIDIEKHDEATIDAVFDKFWGI